jgi:hypothetical protein
MDQPRARLITQLLEPAAPDSFIRWGFFDAIFEEKEYAEARVLEGIARQMLAADPALKAEFDERLKDEAFAADPRARLRFSTSVRPTSIRRGSAIRCCGWMRRHWACCWPVERAVSPAAGHRAPAKAGVPCACGRREEPRWRPARE